MPELLLAAKKFGCRSRKSDYTVADATLAEFLKEHRECASNSYCEVSGKITFGEAFKIHRQNQADDVTIEMLAPTGQTVLVNIANVVLPTEPERAADAGGSWARPDNAELKALAEATE